MKLTPIKSSAINGAAYDPETKTLHLEFASGSTYTYADVSAEKFAALRSADSAGKYIAQHIRPHHTGTRL